MDTNAPEMYFNRELSFLEFCSRVLAQSLDETTPLLERLRFLCIAGSILDEFFEIRVAGLQQQEAVGSAQRGADNLTATEQLRRIEQRVPRLVAEQYRILNEELLPRLAAHGIRLIEPEEWNTKQQAWLKRYFNRELAPVVTPIGLDPAHPFPQPLNKSLNFIVTLEGKDAFGRSGSHAVVQAPRVLPRLVRLPERVASGPYDFVLLSSIMQTHISELFPGMRATGCFAFRVTRNSDLYVDEEEVDDLLRALEGELSSRRYGDAVRLEIDASAPEELATFLMTQFHLSAADVYRCDGPLNLNRLAQLPELVDRVDLKYPGFTPSIDPAFRGESDLFAVIAKQDVLLHHPFQSFAPFIDFLRQAARDPDVLAIRQTLYRTGANSAVVQALAEAARNRKEVMVVIELRARFDEEANISLANHLQSAGAQVVYGVVGHKAHAKMCLVLRREGRKLARYVHLGTGNYHTRTARLYTDYGLFTSDAAICEDVQQIFQQLTAMGRGARLKKLLQAPFTLHSTMLEKIDAEARAALEGRPARIMAKMNSLIEPAVIEALYRASRAGVEIDLIVRGICTLRPGVEGVSEHIRVRSIVGRFLEHTRVFYFENGGEPLVYLSSADWMGRNFFNRVETAVPLEDPGLRVRVVREVFTNYLADNTQAWQLNSDGEYTRVKQGRAQRRCAQEILLGELSE